MSALPKDLTSPPLIAGATGIQRIMPRHFKIIDMAVAGHDASAIAKTLNISVSSVSLVLKSPFAQAEIARLRKDGHEGERMGLDRDATLGKARSILEQATVGAATKLQDLMESCPDPAIQQRSANSILDRVFGKGDNGGGAKQVINITAEHVNLLNQALKESDNARRLPSANGTLAFDPPPAAESLSVYPESGGRIGESGNGPSTGSTERGEGDV